MAQTHLLAAGVEKVMQTEKDVGRIAQATPVMIGMGAAALL